MSRESSMAPEAGQVLASQVLAGAISRDFRTPLHSLLGFLQLLGMSDLDEDQQRMFEYIMGDADTLARAADRLLLLVRLVAGDEPDRSEEFEFSELLGAVTAGTGTEVHIKLDRRVPATLVGDVVNLRQMLRELLDNAVNHAYGPITLRVEVTGQLTDDSVPLRFSVSDAGAGLLDEQLAFIEAPLSTLPGHGQGIGLYLIKHILAQLGGHLVVTPPSGGAATVSADLHLAPVPAIDEPVPPVASPPAPAATTPPELATAGRLRVLLVEDNAVNLILAQRQMKLLGHDLHTATRGELGVSAARDGEYDIILMDRHLPDIDGVEAARQIRQAEVDSGRRRTPIVAVTADAMPRNREECLAAGMDGFLTKPLDLAELGATLVALAPAPAAAEASANDAVDPAALHDLAEQLGAPEMVAELAHAYLSELPGRRLLLQGAIRRSSAADIVSTGEALRSPSETVGAFRLAELCQDIVDAARAGDIRAVHDKLPLLQEACQQTTSAMAAIPDASPLGAGA